VFLGSWSLCHQPRRYGLAGEEDGTGLLVLTGEALDNLGGGRGVTAHETFVRQYLM
jgi:hypothetical protein